MIVASFDPGLTGAVAFDHSDGAPDWASVHDLPLMGANKQIVLNGMELGALLRKTGVQHAVIEHVHSMPRQGVSSTFKFGTVFGQILGVVQALGISYELVSPQKWKREMGIAGKQEDGAEFARGRALELFPALHSSLARKKDHNRAEALLLGRWWLDRHRKGE